MNDVQIFALLQFWMYKLYVSYSNPYTQYGIFQIFLQQFLNLGKKKKKQIVFWRKRVFEEGSGTLKYSCALIKSLR